MRKYLGRRAVAASLLTAVGVAVLVPATTSCVPRRYCYGSYAALRCYSHPRHGHA